MQDDQSQPTKASIETVAQNDKNGNSKKQTISIVILSIITLVSIAFGIFGMINSNSKNQEIERLKTRVSEVSNQVTKSEITDTTINLNDDTSNTTSVINSSEYLFLSDWGIKIKLGDNLNAFNITHFNSNINNIALDEYIIETVFKDYFNLLSKNYYLIVSYPRNYIIRSKDAVLDLGDIQLEPIYNDGEYNYFTHPSTGYAYESPDNNLFTDSERDSFNEAYFKTTEIFKNSENYSRI